MEIKCEASDALSCFGNVRKNRALAAGDSESPKLYSLQDGLSPKKECRRTEASGVPRARAVLDEFIDASLIRQHRKINPCTVARQAADLDADAAEALRRAFKRIREGQLMPPQPRFADEMKRCAQQQAQQAFGGDAGYQADPARSLRTQECVNQHHVLTWASRDDADIVSLQTSNVSSAPGLPSGVLAENLSSFRHSEEQEKYPQGSIVTCAVAACLHHELAHGDPKLHMTNAVCATGAVGYEQPPSSVWTHETVVRSPLWGLVLRDDGGVLHTRRSALPQVFKYSQGAIEVQEGPPNGPRACAKTSTERS